MSMSEYELSLVAEAKKGKKKAWDRLYDSCHKTLCDVIEREIGDRSRAETILGAVFGNLKAQIKLMADPAQFESMAIQATIAECKNYPRVDKPADASGATQFAAYESPKNKAAGMDRAADSSDKRTNTPDIQPAPFRQPEPAPYRQPEPAPYQQPVNDPYRQPEPAPGRRPEPAPVGQPAPIRQPAPAPYQQPVNDPYQQSAAQMKTTPADDPVIGWLVCINGMDRGVSYPLLGKINTIGSSQSNDIQIHGESDVAAENHACIAYDEQTTACILLVGVGRKVSLNGEYNDYSQPLNKFDIITIGNSQFVYAPSSEGLEWRRQYGL